MCGRFNLHADPHTIAWQFGLTTAPQIQPRYNIAPTQSVLAVFIDRETKHREFGLFRWGLIPHWAKELGRYSTINARAETLAEKPAYRGPFRYKRCLVPATGFYEWAATGNGKQPYLIRHTAGQPFAIAGLYDTWTDPQSHTLIPSLTLIVTEANALIRPLHERMPVILEPDDYATWLDPQRQRPDTLSALLKPHSGDGFERIPVSKSINSPKNDDPSVLTPARMDDG